MQASLLQLWQARALCKALSRGVLLGERVAMPSSGPWIDRARAALGWVGGVTVEGAESEILEEVHGGRRVTGARLTHDADRREVRCDAAAVEGTAVASYELAGQSGAPLRWSERRGCFEPTAGDDGETDARGVYVCGSLRLGDAPVAHREQDGERVAARVADDLRAGRV